MNTVALGEVAEINPRGNRPSLHDEVAFVGMADLSAETGVATPSTVRPYAEVLKGYTLFRDQDLLVAKITPCFENGKTGQANLSRPFGVGSTEFHVVRPNGQKIDHRYALHFLRQDWIRHLGELRMTGSAGQRRIPAGFLADLRVPLPPIEEQRRIAAILDAAHRIDSQRIHSLLKFETLVRSRFNATLPVDRPRVAMRDLAIVVTKGTTPSSLGLPMAKDGVPFLRAQNLMAGTVLHGAPSDLYIDLEVHLALKRSIVRERDLLLSIAGTIGRSALVASGSPEMNCNQAVALIRLRQPDLGRWIQHWLETTDARSQMGTSSVTGTISNLSLRQVGSLRIPAPNAKDLSSFNSWCTIVETSRDRLTVARARTEKLFSSLQARAFSGRL